MAMEFIFIYNKRYNQHVFLYFSGLAEADENCKRFMDRALPECFKKVSYI